MPVSRKTILLALVCGAAMPADAQLLDRSGPSSGTIISTKGGEQAQLVPDARLRTAVARQVLKPGDTLRTNALGTLAVVFADQTQVRLGRNTVLVVKAVAAGSPSALALRSGSLWARAPRGQAHLSVETPSATAAVRGTDWALEVTDQNTRLDVFDGTIDFFNDQGKLSVTAGQAASAKLGRAPTRIFTVNSTERAQMAYYLPIEGLFEVMAPTQGYTAADRAGVVRLRAIPPDRRSAEEWLALAEGDVVGQPSATTSNDLAKARGLGLDEGQQARAAVVDGYLLAGQRRWAEARDRFDTALPRLDGSRRVVADYARYVAAIRADPATAGKLEPPVARPELVQSWVGQVLVAAFAGDIPEARRLAEEASRRFPDDPVGPVMLAQIGKVLDDPKLMEAQAAEALRRDPGSPDALEVRSDLRSDFHSDLEGARADLLAARAILPGSAAIANDLAELESDRDATRASARTFRDAIAEHPGDPLLRFNQAITLMDENRLAAARHALDEAARLDPDMPMVHALRGRYYHQLGDNKAAFPEALAASAADPADATSLLILGMIYYRRGDYDVAMQQVDASQRLDPAGYVAPLVRAAFAQDRDDLDAAIVNARAAQKLSLARGGDYANLSHSSSSGGFIASSFRTLGLDEWGSYYGDQLFDPFTSTGYFDRAASQQASPFLSQQVPDAVSGQRGTPSDSLSNVVQGLLIEPLAVASSDRVLQLYPERFFEIEGTVGFEANNRGIRPTANGTMQGTILDPLPVALSLNVSTDGRSGPAINNRDSNQSATGFLTTELTPYDKLVAFGAISEKRDGVPGDRAITPFDPVNTPLNGEAHQYGRLGILGYSHEFGRKSMLSLGFGASKGRSALTRYDNIIDHPDSLFVAQEDVLVHSRIVAGSYAANVGMFDVTLGADDTRVSGHQRTQRALILDGNLFQGDEPQAFARSVARGYLDIRATLSARAQIEGQILSTEAAKGRVLDYAIAGAVSPHANHWLRAGWFRQTETAQSFTFAPTRAAGLIPNPLPLPQGGRARTLMARWDAEWRDDLFTSVDVQHQRADSLSIARPDLIAPIALDAAPFGFAPPYGYANFEFGKSRLDRVSFSMNYWLHGGFGLRGNYAHAWSHVGQAAGPGTEGRIPLLPRDYASAGIVWVNPSRVHAAFDLVYTGARRSLTGQSRIVGGTVVNELLDRRLGEFVTADASVGWENHARNIALDLNATNLLDKGYRLITTLPGYDRTVSATATLRF
ncbi:hypothetical protein DMC47_32910 [Nostoc sp. 3335mG]|nr:hypothetical protein DMC47_32910 [Nostoc sp. 3335mG]